MQDTNPDNGPAVSSLKKLALPVGLAPTLFPQTTGCFSFQLRERSKMLWYTAKRRLPGEGTGRFHSAFCILQSALRLVGGAGNAPVVTSDIFLRHRFYRPAAGTPPRGKAELRITKSETSRKAEPRISILIAWILRASDFGVPSAFGDSDFGFKLVARVGITPT